jgi:hypothetical protein
MEYATGLLVFIVLAMTGINYYIKNKDVVVIPSKIDGRKYRIADGEDSQACADLLAEINMDILKLIDHLKSNDDENIQRLCKRYNPDRLGENLEYKSYKAYSVNKGEEIVLCLHDKDGNIIKDKNTMKFVLIHELAHIMTVENGHPPIFWENMGNLLKHANSIGVYDAIDYSKNPVQYCGVLVDKTPYPF